MRAHRDFEKVLDTLDSITDKLVEAIQKGADKSFPQICEAQQELLELLIGLNPSFGLDN